MFPWLLHASFLSQYRSSERLMANGWWSKTQVEFIPGFLPITNRVRPHWASYHSHRAARCYRKNSCEQFPTSSIRFSLLHSHTYVPRGGPVFWSTASIVLSGPLTGVNKESTNINACASDNRVCHFVSITNAAQFSGSWIFCHHLHTRGMELVSIHDTGVREGKKWSAYRSVSMWTQLT